MTQFEKFNFFTQNSNRLYLTQCLLFLAVLGIVFSFASPSFLSAANVSNILTASAVIGLMAIGTTFVIAAGAIDLSSAAVMALSGTAAAYAVQNGFVASPGMAALIAVAVGGLSGLLTGFLINVTKAPSFIVTLGMMSVARATAFIVSDGKPFYGLPENIMGAGQGDVMGMPIHAAFLLSGALLGFIVLAKTKFGVHTLVLGDNPFAAEAMGIATQKLRLKIFGLAGAYSGLAGLVFMLRTNAGDPSSGQGYELIAITAAILGGANLFGGRASILGTVLGVLCLGVLQNGLNLLAVSTYYQILFVGLVLVAAAFLSRAGSRS